MPASLLTDLEQADLITSEEYKKLEYVLGQYDISDVVRFQSGKSPEVMTKLLKFWEDMDFHPDSLQVDSPATIIWFRHHHFVMS